MRNLYLRQDLNHILVAIMLPLRSVPRSSLFYEFCDIYTLLAYLNSPPLFTIRTDSPKNTSVGNATFHMWWYQLTAGFEMKQDNLVWEKNS
jgi:hypothetical protein